MTSRTEKSKELKKKRVRELRLEKRKKRKKFLLKFLFTLIFLIVLIVLYARFVEPNLLVVHEKKIVNSRITSNFDGLKIVHFSDLHYGNTITKDTIERVIHKINQLKPDIVVFTGDLVDKDYKTTKEDVKVLTAAFSNIDSVYGKYAVIGNHDFYYESYDNILYDSGFMLLKNTYDTVYNDNQNPMVIYGVDNITYGTPSLEGLKDKKLEDMKYKIILVHEGDYVDKIVKDYDVDLILGGHSHNGQIKIPFVKPFILPEGSKKYYDSYYKVKNTDVFISNGIGTSIFNFRLASVPSINFYRLEKK